MLFKFVLILDIKRIVVFCKPVLLEFMLILVIMLFVVVCDIDMLVPFDFVNANKVLQVAFIFIMSFVWEKLDWSNEPTKTELEFKSKLSCLL